MKQSELDYKQETGFASSRGERVYNHHGSYDYQTVPYDEYIEWLEEKYEELLKIRTEHHISYEEEFDDALAKIGQLEDQLENAKDEIRDLQYEIKVRPQ